MTYDWILYVSKNQELKEEVIHLMSSNRNIELMYMDMFRIEFDHVEKEVIIRPFSEISKFNWKIVPTKAKYSAIMKMLEGDWNDILEDDIHYMD